MNKFSRLIIFILALFLSISIAINIFQYKNVQSIKTESQSVQLEIDTMNLDIAKQGDIISARQEQITTLQSELEELEDYLKSLETENINLSNELAELKSEPAAIEIVEEPAPVEPQITDPTPQGNNGLINPNTGAPLQPGDHGVTNGFEWEYVGDDTGLF